MAKKRPHKIHTRKRENLELRFALSYAASEAIRTRSENQPIDADAVKFLIERKVPGASALIMFSRFGECLVDKVSHESNADAYETMAENYHILCGEGDNSIEAAFIAGECQKLNGGKDLSQYGEKNNTAYSNILEAIANIQE